MKVCKTCAAELPASEFNRSPNYRDGMNSSCRTCTNKRSRDWQNANRKRAQETKKAWEAAHPEKVSAHKKRYRETHREGVRESYAAWVANNPQKKEDGRQRWRERNRAEYLVACAKASKKWRAGNPEKVTAKTARRRAQIRMALVTWADRGAMLEFYRHARRLTTETGERHEVDHVIPLQSKLVCGLHNEFNMRVITATANREKRNRFSPQRQGRLIA